VPNHSPRQSHGTRSPILLLACFVLSAGAVGRAGPPAPWVEERFDDLVVGNLLNQSSRASELPNWGRWACESWNPQSHLIVEGVSAGSDGKSVEVRTVNGYHNRIALETQFGGVIRCRFDWQPRQGQWTFAGFKRPDAGWDEYQATIMLQPPKDGGHVFTWKGRERIQIDTAPMQPGDGTSAGPWYAVEMTVHPRAVEGQPGTYSVKITGPDGTIAEAGPLEFSHAADQAVETFEIRSIKWSEPEGEVNGYFDNLVIEPEPSAPRISIACEKWGHVYHKGKPIALQPTILAGTQAAAGPAALTVFDPYDQVIFEQTETRTVEANGIDATPVTIPAEKLERYGLYRVRLTFGEGDQAVSAKTTFLVVEPPDPSISSFDSPFGAFHYPQVGEDGKWDLVVDQMYDIGVRWLRLNFHWHSVEPEKGKLDWGVMGKFADCALAHDMHVMAEVANTPKWASTAADDERIGAIDTGAGWMSVAPRDFADWENFCRKTAERFGGKVKYFEVWNEPGAPLDYKNFNGFYRDSSDNFIKLIQTARQAVRSVVPDAQLVSSGYRCVDIGPHFDHFVERVLAGAADDIDVFAFHGGGHGGNATKYHDVRILLKQYGRDIPIWDTEGPGLSRDTYNTVTGYIEEWARGVEKMFGFIYVLPRYGSSNLVNPDYTPSIGTAAFATMTRFLAGAEMEGPLRPGPAVRAYSLRKGDTRIIAAWSEAGEERVGHFYNAKETFDWQGNPGPQVEPGGYAVNQVSVPESPIYIFCPLDLGLPEPKEQE